MTPDIANDARLDPRLRRMLELMPQTPLDDVANRDELLAEANSPRRSRGGRPSGPSRRCATPRRRRPRPACRSARRSSCRSPTATPSTCRSSAPTPTRRSPASTTSMAAAWPRCPASTACTAAGASSSPPTASPSSWSTSATASWPRRRPRWRPSRPGSTTASRACAGSSPTPRELGIDPDRIVVAGESGGGNLTLATGLKLKRDGDLGLIKGLYALCPYIAGQWPAPDCPSSIENEGILLNLHNNRGAMGYGIEAFDERNPLAWPSFATRRRRRRLSADRDQRQRVRPAARRGHQLLPPAARGRGPGALPPDDGHHARHRDLLHRLPRHQPRHRPGHRRLRPRLARSAGPPRSRASGPLRSPAVTNPNSFHRPFPRALRDDARRPGPGRPSGVAGVSGSIQGPVVRAALPPGKINHILVIEFENEGYEATFGPAPRHLPERHAAPGGRAAAELLRHRA